MRNLRVNTPALVDNPVSTESYPRINGTALWPDLRINGTGLTHKWYRILITYMYLYKNTCSWLRLSVENLVRFTHSRLAATGECAVGWFSGNPFLNIQGKKT